MVSDEVHQSADFEMMPDLVCGRSYRNPESEAQAVAMRTCEVTPYTGCGKPMRWIYAYRCRQCGRWMHGPCMDRHFGVVGCPATRDGQADLTAENERLRWAVSGGKEIIDGQAARIRALTAEVARLDGQVVALREALAFYAEPRQYNRAGGDPVDAEPLILSDLGRQARAALAAAGRKAETT